MDDAQLTLVNTPEAGQAFLTWLQEPHACLAVDTETEGLDFWRHDVRLIQVGDSRAGWAFPWDGWGGFALSAVDNYCGPVVMHNAPFDVVMTESHSRYQFDWARLHDTRQMTHLDAPDMPTALKNASDRHLGYYASSAQKALDFAMSENKWDWSTVPVDFPMYWGYACIDTILTARLFERLEPKIRRDFPQAYDLEMSTARIVSNMHRRGAAIDLQYCADKRDELGEYIENATSYVRNTYGVSPSSNQQVAAWLEREGWFAPDAKKTAGGKHSLDDEVLQELIARGSELASLVSNIRKATKIRSTYFDNFLTMHDNGILHPSINQVGARTGRMSITAPALQTLPRGSVVRNAFVSRHDDGVVITADSDQIEMRLLAHFAQDQGLIDAINSGDLHTATAQKVYGDPTLTKKDPRRQLAKNAGFAKIYGAGVAKFALTAGVPVAEAQTFLTEYDRLFPGVRAFQKRVEMIAHERADERSQTYVCAPSGRRHPSELSQAYKLVNYLVQGTAADVLKQQMTSLSNAGFDDYMILPVHDEIVFDFPRDIITPDTIKEIEKAMTMTEGWTVPITVSCDGPYERWGDKYA